MTDHFKASGSSTTLTYAFRKGGSMESGFSDTVEVTVERTGPGGDKSVRTQCLSGSRAVQLPDLRQISGNPALLCFLERDIHEMERLTGGKANYFRKRIRIALAEKAELQPIKIAFAGRQLEGREIRISPYVNDPLRARFEKFAHKYYVFKLSDQIPGGILELDAIIPDASAGDVARGEDANLIEEVLTLNETESGEKK